MDEKTYVKIIHDFSDKFNNFIILLEDIKREIESETIQKLLSSGHMYGEFDIPIFPDSYINSIIDIKDKTIVDQSKFCVRFNRFWFEDKILMCEYEYTDTPYGKLFKLLKEGYDKRYSGYIKFAPRCFGTIEQYTDVNIVRNFRLITFDVQCLKPMQEIVEQIKRDNLGFLPFDFKSVLTPLNTSE